MADDERKDRTARRGRWALISAVALLTLAGAVLRIAKLDHPMRYDESFTVLQYAFSPDPADWVNYSTPNNHVLHTLLVRASAEIAGITPPAIRLPAFLAGVAMIPVAALLAYRLTRLPSAAVTAAALVCGSSLLVEYSVNARGYSILCLLTLLPALAAVEMCRRPRALRPWVGFCAVSAVGAFTIPIMVYPTGIIAIAVVAQALIAGGERRRIVLKRLPLALAATAVVTALLYLPVFAVSGVGSVVANRFVTPQPRSEVLAELPEIAVRTLADWTRDTSWPWRVVVGAGLAGAAVAGARKRNVWLLVPPLAAVVLPGAAAAHGVVPFPRVWLFVLPLSLVVAACGLAWLASLPRRGRVRLPAVGAAVLAVLVLSADAGVRSLRREYMISEDHRTLVDAEQVIRDLQAESLADGQAALLSELPSWPSLEYYALLHGGGFRRADDPACVRAVAVVGHTQTLESVLEANAQVAGRFGPFEHWRSYSRAEVYVAPAY